MLVFFFTRSFLEQGLQYLNLPKVNTIASLSSNVRGTALLLRECLKKRTQQGFVVILVNSTLEPNCTEPVMQKTGG